MKTNAVVTGTKGKVKLTFGVFSLKHFCRRLGCEPTIFSVLTAFQGGTRMEAMAEVIRTGVEQRQADSGEPVSFSDYQACEVLETATELEAEKAMKAFLSSIVNEDYDAWFAKLQADYDKAIATEEEADQSEKKSGTGTTSSEKPTAKSD